MAKSESVSIRAGKLTKSDDTQIKSGESRISKEHWDKCSAKCKGENSMITKLGISDERTKIKKEK